MYLNPTLVYDIGWHSHSYVKHLLLQYNSRHYLL